MLRCAWRRENEVIARVRASFEDSFSAHHLGDRRGLASGAVRQAYRFVRLDAGVTARLTCVRKRRDQRALLVAHHIAATAGRLGAVNELVPPIAPRHASLPRSSSVHRFRSSGIRRLEERRASGSGRIARAYAASDRCRLPTDHARGRRRPRAARRTRYAVFRLTRTLRSLADERSPTVFTVSPPASRVPASPAVRDILVGLPTVGRLDDASTRSWDLRSSGRARSDFGADQTFDAISPDADAVSRK